ncbi:hypothetical protein CLAFUW4_11551 [Fulvia fulva]|uniref:RRM domain-containing protein n=1 Tax=Passalora fulva TaxID=5499 RepID=A0A9Q8URR8_PASFU|nr:uncharacterized protein CLAFUR5_10594 [Fulvia fulva]KAK4620153.1 hypothetical protein CLAFUR4_11557 [Fulvia fulva]KAK4621001.1 hypothetical protein CLAFUR0_11565 [Fulvia fulva]UJO20007.1 hypothetical protein CLAFUR5_10594 [Fulvia fulva]WPV17386.1 hypothetical protein CLAFUW4_11551 [Fulvia fulva]WPV32280.1 hypothetical protein CLAFUW7_11556 [Fulvia fulva]
MANDKQAADLNAMIKQHREKNRPQILADKIFSKERRSKTPVNASQGKGKPAAAPGGSLASRIGAAGVTKRTSSTSSVTRSNTAPPRNGRPPPQARPLPPTRPSAPQAPRARDLTARQPASDPPSDVRSNGYNGYDAPVANGNGASMSIRGAAGPFVVLAANFAPGTTAADIESVMQEIGGECSCKILELRPDVLAQMTFTDRIGAEKVISTFNGKKADGRTLHVYWSGSAVTQPEADVEVPVDAVMDDSMEVDENAQSREAQDRLREERRGGPDRRPRDDYPAGPRDNRGYMDHYYRGPRRQDGLFQDGRQDGRYGYQGDRFGGGGPRGRYRDEGRMYSDGMRRGGGGGQSYRP